MNTTKIETNTELIELLSKITEKEQNHKNVSFSIKFTVTLAIFLTGIITANTEIKSTKSKKLIEILNYFIDPENQAKKFARSMYGNVRINNIHLQENKISLFSNYFSVSQKLLLIALGLELSATDGDICLNEKQYLEKVAKLLSIDLSYLAVLEAGFNGNENIDTCDLAEVRNLLKPTNFQDLDIAFTEAANKILAVLPECPEDFETNDTVISDNSEYAVNQSVSQSSEFTPDVNDTTSSYQLLQEFQQTCKTLDNYCYQLFQTVQESNKYNFIPNDLCQEISEISRNLQSQSFRIAVVGEFSQGKSTLLNALLGEEIQPVRAIPCSGTVTVLKYGTEKRVICRYKDGREEEIPFEQYQEKASISEEAALDGVSDELITSEIKEIVFEHPDLELCRHGVEIVDSPGLNEHPERTSITQQLIKDTDAIIFLTNASRPLTQGERELIEDLKHQLNEKQTNIPAENLFILVNFMDLLRREKDRQSVKERVRRFAQGDNPIIAGKNRIHFISAQAALDAIIDDYDDEYLNNFNSFTQSIETFLIKDIGKIKINKNVNNLENIIEQYKEQKQQYKREILELIGEISNWDFQLLQLATTLQESSIDESVESWNIWVETLGEKIYSKSEQWSCTHDDEEKILKNYTKKFNKALSQELNDWLTKEVKNKILKNSVGILDTEIESVRESIEDLLNQFDTQVSGKFKQQIQIHLNGQSIDMNISKSNIEADDGDGVGFGFGLGGAGVIAGGLVFAGIGLIPIALAALGGGLGIGALFGETNEAKVKRIVLEKGFENFNNSVEEILDKIAAEIAAIFNRRIDLFSETNREAILILENIIEEQENLNKQSQTIEQIEKDIDQLLTRLIK